MSILSAFSSKEESKKISNHLKDFLVDFSIEVMPRTASKIESFNEILPQNTRVYIAHIEGVPIEEMVETAKRLSNEGFDVMPHFPARIIKDKDTLENWIQRYQDEAGIEQALLLAGRRRKTGIYRSAAHYSSIGRYWERRSKRAYAGHIRIPGCPYDWNAGSIINSGTSHNLPRKCTKIQCHLQSDQRGHKSRERIRNSCCSIAFTECANRFNERYGLRQRLSVPSFTTGSFY